MQVAAIALVAASLLSAGAASAADRVSDMTYLKASRCSGLASGLKSPEAGDLAAYVKQQADQREPAAVARGQWEFDRAERQTRSEDGRARLAAELASACTSYMGGAKDVAARGVQGSVANR